MVTFSLYRAQPFIAIILSRWIISPPRLGAKRAQHIPTALRRLPGIIEHDQPASNRDHQLRLTSAVPALGRELGYSKPAMIPTLVRQHRVRQPVCSEPVYCVTTPVITGPIANPSPDKVLTRDTSTATSRGRMPGNSNGSTSRWETRSTLPPFP